MGPQADVSVPFKCEACGRDSILLKAGSVASVAAFSVSIISPLRHLNRYACLVDLRARSLIFPLLVQRNCFFVVFAILVFFVFVFIFERLASRYQ